MIGVMTAHFGWIFSKLHAEFTLGIELAKRFEPSAPTFMVISGFLLGYIYEMRHRELGSYALKLMDRGLFLLTVRQLVIMAAYLSYSGGLCGAQPPDWGKQSQGYFVPMAAAIRTEINVPIVVAGGITDPYAADKVIREGQVELIAIGRAMLTNPEWSTEARAALA